MELTNRDNTIVSLKNTINSLKELNTILIKRLDIEKSVWKCLRFWVLHIQSKDNGSHKASGPPRTPSFQPFLPGYKEVWRPLYQPQEVWGILWGAYPKGGVPSLLRHQALRKTQVWTRTLRRMLRSVVRLQNHLPYVPRGCQGTRKYQNRVPRGYRGFCPVVHCRANGNQPWCSGNSTTPWGHNTAKPS